MRTIVRFGALALAIAATLALAWLRSVSVEAAPEIDAGIEATDATPEQLELARWAVRRFQIAGLEPPAVRISFHWDRSGCGGHLGLAKEGEVDVCTTLLNTMTRRVVLHEISHIWLDQYLDGIAKAQFLAQRGLPSWNASRDPWELRGYEQSAEIIAWALGERILTAQIPDNDPGSMAEAYRLLTGQPLPESQTMVG